jgi:hypothetical protein
MDEKWCVVLSNLQRRFFFFFSPLGSEIDAAIYRIILRSSGIVVREKE